MSNKILVTGGAGYLGSVLVRRLLEWGNEVTVLDNLMFGQNSLLDCCSWRTFHIVRGDVRDKEVVQRLLADKDFIIPMAALVGAPLCDRDRTAAQTTNVDAIRTLVKMLAREQRIVIPTSNSGYGIGQEGISCTETTPLRPISLYGRTKVEAEQIVLDRGNGISLRLATAFGVSPRMRLDLIVNDFTYRAVKDRFLVVFEGHFRRNYIHVQDVARAFGHALTHFESMNNQCYNVGLSDANLSKLELCAEIKRRIPDFVFLEAEIGADVDRRNYLVSNEKLARTGFRTEYSLERGVEELIKGFAILNGARYRNA